jgi:uncharacterized protein YijF (DUF1287 family)
MSPLKHRQLHRRDVIASLGLLLGTGPLALAQLEAPAQRLIAQARTQIGVTTHYDPAYRRLDYPGGDVPRERGVCTDVAIRAFRDAFAFDLQRAVHEDMRADFRAYPAIWGLSRPDRNIDHRRVPNLETFLTRQGARRSDTDFAPGDLLTCRLPGNLPHIAIVSDSKGRDGLWQVIHNIGAGTREESLIGQYEREARFTFFPATPAP